MDKEKLIKCAEETEVAVAEALNALYKAKNAMNRLTDCFSFEEKKEKIVQMRRDVWDISRKVDFTCETISEQFFKTLFCLSKKVETLEEEKKENVLDNTQL